MRSSHTSSQQSNELGKTILTAFTGLLKKVLVNNDKDSVDQIVNKIKQVSEEDLNVTVTAKKGTLHAYDRLSSKDFDFGVYFDDNSFTSLKALIYWCRQ